MDFSSSLERVATLPFPDDFSLLSQHLDPDWIDQSLEATGVVTLRRRRLPAEQLPWLVIGMALMRGRPISEVVSKLELAMPQAGNTSVAPSAVTKARARLGESPMAWLFARSADHWAHRSADDARWNGLALYSVDGTTLRVPDTEENREHFGLASGGHRGTSGYPLVRMVALMAIRSHIVAAASFGPYDRSEHHYAQDLWPCLPNESLVIVDRNYWSANILLPLQEDGQERHWLIRGKSDLAGTKIQSLGRNDELRAFQVSSVARAKNPSLPKTYIGRVIKYQRKGFRPQTLITSLLDVERYPSGDIVALYHERWEIELAYREIKTQMLDNLPLRSKLVDGIRQEIWGILIAYNLIRLEMERAAVEANVPPIRISFVMTYRMIADEWLWAAIASPGAIPRHLRRLRDSLKDFILPPRRSHRSYPRAVKVKMSNYARKRRDEAV